MDPIAAFEDLPANVERAEGEDQGGEAQGGPVGEDGGGEGGMRAGEVAVVGDGEGGAVVAEGEHEDADGVRNEAENVANEPEQREALRPPNNENNNNNENDNGLNFDDALFGFLNIVNQRDREEAQDIQGIDFVFGFRRPISKMLLCAMTVIFLNATLMSVFVLLPTFAGKLVKRYGMSILFLFSFYCCFFVYCYFSDWFFVNI
jgi:hypothetical protein